MMERAAYKLFGNGNTAGLTGGQELRVLATSQGPSVQPEAPLHKGQEGSSQAVSSI